MNMKFSLFYPVADYEENKSLSSLYKETIDMAILAESLGFECIYFNEGHGKSPNYKCPNARILISAIAQHTASLQLGVAITGLTMKDPRFLAEDVIMLDSICKGRLIFGHSTGHVSNFREFGIDPNAVNEIYKIKVQAFLAFLKGQFINSELEFLRYEDASVALAPEFPDLHQRIFQGTTSLGNIRDIASKGMKLGFTLKTLPSQGQFNDSRSFEILSNVVKEYFLGWAASEMHSSSPPPISLNLMAHIFDDKSSNFDLVSSCMDRYWSVLTGMKQPKDLHIARYFEDGISPMGSVKCVVERLKKIDTVGIKSVMLCFDFGNMPKEVVINNMKRFSSDVMPHFKH